MFLAKILYECHKAVLEEHVDLLFKCFLVPITLLVAGRVFRKAMFPQHMRTNTADASCVLKVTESFLKLFVFPIRLKEAQPLFCSNL
jgi:hypothetical protein